MSLEALIQAIVNLAGGPAGKNFALIGTLGAGKTHLVRSLIQALEPELLQDVASPSFNIFHRYEGKKIEIHHFDLYRLEAVEELEEIEIYESLDNVKALTLIEWPDQFDEIVNMCDYKVHVQVNEKGKRDYLVEGFDERV